MDRRRFLLASASLSAAGLVGGIAFAPHAEAAALLPKPRLLRLDVSTQRFVPLASLPSSPNVGALRLHIDAFLPAADSSLQAMRMEALFGDLQAPWRHLAWHYVRGDQFGSSRAAGFDLGGGSFCGLSLQLQAAGSAPSRQIHCLDSSELGALAPGRYLLLLDNAGGDPRNTQFSGNWQLPLASSAADYFALRVEALQAAPDLAARADLACLACADAAIAA